jgi:hypothetical protein
MFEVRGFDGAPMFFLFNEKLLLPAMGTDDMARKSRFDHLNLWGSCHSMFLPFLEDTLPCLGY